MGAYLSEPKTEKDTETGTGHGLRHGLSGMQGWRAEMEDAHIAENNMPIDGMSFYGVFDGHGGSMMSNDVVLKDSGLLSDFLASAAIKGKQEDPKVLGEALRKSFIDFDERKKPGFLDREERSGCTATTVLITKSHIICANSGDSRTVMCKDGAAVPLSFDHKPSNEGEKLRIEGAGGSVMMNRVNGDLAVSRALGDFVYKGNNDLPPEKQMVSPEPEIIIKDRSPQDQFVILACDGVWDVMSNQDACDFVLNNRLKYPDLGYLCEAVLDRCLELNSRDNMTICIIAFQGFELPNAEQSKALKAKIDEERVEAKRRSEEAQNADNDH